ncbi:aminotransferase [archaeon SCG-AAA382B04]|nr:aminotransferase [archaeon SCG-AAA382B04]
MELFIPGPVNVNKELREELSKPMIGHRSKEFSELYNELIPKLKKLTQTRNKVFISTSSSTGLMEASIRNTVSKKCLNLVNGAFGRRWHNITKRNGKKCETISKEWGEPIRKGDVEEKVKEKDIDCVTLIHNESSAALENPVEEISEAIPDDTLFLVDTVSSMGGVDIPVDEWDIDICLFGTQKCLGLPPGLAFFTVSQKAIEKSKEVKDKGYYFSLDRFLSYDSKDQTITTPNIPLLYVLNQQLEDILNEEGLEKRWKRHKEMAQITRNWAKKHFDVFPNKGYESKTLTAVENTKNIQVTKLIQKLRERNYLISNGYGKLSEKTFRIGHLADKKPSQLRNLLKEINDILDLV